MSSSASTLDSSTLPPFVDAGEGRLMMALKFYEIGRLSLGQAAELAGYTKLAPASFSTTGRRVKRPEGSEFRSRGPLAFFSKRKKRE